MVPLFNSLKVQEIVDKDNPARSTFIFQDLPLQMGTFFGNLLRQVLFNHVSGIAPLAVEIHDQNGPAKTKFDVLSGVSENGIVANLILNLKEIIWVAKNSPLSLFCCELKVENKSKKERIVTAGEFQVGSEVEIKNPELKLAVLSPGGELNIKLYCQENWGYHQIEEKSESEKEEVENFIKKHFPKIKGDLIFPDVDYSPLKGGLVSFQIEKDRFKKKEKLTLSIQNKENTAPREVFLEAVRIVSSLLTKTIEQLDDNKSKITSPTKKASKTETE